MGRTSTGEAEVRDGVEELRDDSCASGRRRRDEVRVPSLSVKQCRTRARLVDREVSSHKKRAVLFDQVIARMVLRERDKDELLDSRSRLEASAVDAAPGCAIPVV